MTYSTQELNYFTEELVESQSVQKAVDILCRIVEACNCQKGSIANISRDMLTQILEYLTEDVENKDDLSIKEIEVVQRREKQLLLLLHVVPATHWDDNYVLDLAVKSRFHQVCGYIRAKNDQYVAVLDSYMKLMHAPIHAYSFIHDRLEQLRDKDYADFEVSVISRIPGLVTLSREGAYVLIAHHFMGKYQDILSKLQSQPESLFLFLKAVVEVCKTGTLDFSRLLLCKYDHESVLQFLETSDNYSLERCLHLCKEYQIVDAATFLFERVGDVGSAILINLSNLGLKVVELEREIKKDFSAGVTVNLISIQKKKVVAEIVDIMKICIGLCQRNSPRLTPDEAESLWFQLFDAFFEPLAAADNARSTSMRAQPKKSFDSSVNDHEVDERQKSKRRVSAKSKSSDMKRKLFTVFIKEIVEGMIGYVQLPRIMVKLLSLGDQEFGDVKLTVLGLLGTYDFERRILETAKSVIEDDTYYIMRLLRKGASHGYSPRGFLCYICNSSSSSAFRAIQIFRCGHAVHVDCVVDGNSGSWCCPVCVSRRTSNGSRPMESGELLVSNNRTSKSSKQQALLSSATSFFFHESRESSPPLSRLKLLHNLEIESVGQQLRLAPPALYHEKLLKKGSDGL
ncbi:hypothetical protein M569_01867 [Genlisea aurea]|uniref:RING-type domain-containing protein n=1 Tax=Genlisea aurea TaxID=192259 RepID=S8D675_9LAMI|nr:hypothetical protein M569_01867 [Genlisea aurea]